MRVQQLKSLIHSEGLDAGLRALNQQSPYRYTAIFAFHGEVLRNIGLVDKFDATAARCPDQVVADSYCVYVRRGRYTVAIEDALVDARTLGHPKRADLLSYYGVPLMALSGQIIGTICHFDPGSVRISAEVAEALDAAAGIIAEVISRHVAA